MLGREGVPVCWALDILVTLVKAQGLPIRALEQVHRKVERGTLIQNLNDTVGCDRGRQAVRHHGKRQRATVFNIKKNPDIHIANY